MRFFQLFCLVFIATLFITNPSWGQYFFYGSINPQHHDLLRNQDIQTIRVLHKGGGNKETKPLQVHTIDREKRQITTTNLLGRTSDLKSTVTTYDEQGRALNTKNFSATGQQTGLVYYTYTTDGTEEISNIVIRMTERQDGVSTLDTMLTPIRRTKRYNADGYLESLYSEKSRNGKTETVDHQFTYAFDEEGRIVTLTTLIKESDSEQYVPTYRHDFRYRGKDKVRVYRTHLEYDVTLEEKLWYSKFGIPISLEAAQETIETGEFYPDATYEDGLIRERHLKLNALKGKIESWYYYTYE